MQFIKKKQIFLYMGRRKTLLIDPQTDPNNNIHAESIVQKESAGTKHHPHLSPILPLLLDLSFTAINTPLRNPDTLSRYIQICLDTYHAVTITSITIVNMLCKITLLFMVLREMLK